MKRMNTARRQGGFTLAETLMAVLILLMVTSVVAAGLPAAVSAYQKVVDRANAQIQLSTTVSRLREELGSALWYKETDEAICYSNGNYAERGYVSSLPKTITDGEDAEKGIAISFANVQGASLGFSEPLLSRLGTTAQEKRLYTIYSGLEYSDGIFTVSDLQVKKQGSDVIQAELSELVIRPVREPLPFPESSP